MCAKEVTGDPKRYALYGREQSENGITPPRPVAGRPNRSTATTPLENKIAAFLITGLKCPWDCTSHHCAISRFERWEVDDRVHFTVGRWSFGQSSAPNACCNADFRTEENGASPCAIALIPSGILGWTVYPTSYITFGVMTH